MFVYFESIIPFKSMLCTVFKDISAYELSIITQDNSFQFQPPAKQQNHKTSPYYIGCLHGVSATHRTSLTKNNWHNTWNHFQPWGWRNAVKNAMCVTSATGATNQRAGQFWKTQWKHTLVFGICWKWLDNNHKQVHVILMLSRVVLWTKMTACNVRN